MKEVKTKERKMVSIPADTHLALSEFLEEQSDQTGLRITASSFVDLAIKRAIVHANIKFKEIEEL